MNNIPGITLQTIESVTFAADAAISNEAARAAREAGLADLRSQVEANAANREAFMSDLQSRIGSNRAERLANIENARNMAASAEEYRSMFEDMFDWGGGPGGPLDDIANNVGNIANNTGRVADISEENLKYWRDIAEREAINRFTTAEVNIDFGGISNTVNSNMDLDGIVRYIAEGVEEAIQITAEKVYA